MFSAPEHMFFVILLTARISATLNENSATLANLTHFTNAKMLQDKCCRQEPISKFSLLKCLQSWQQCCYPDAFDTILRSHSVHSTLGFIPCTCLHALTSLLEPVLISKHFEQIAMPFAFLSAHCCIGA